MRSGEQIRATVVEISTTELRYRFFEQPTGPVRIAPLSAVFSIDYEDGKREVFGQPTETNQPQPAATRPQQAGPRVTTTPARASQDDYRICMRRHRTELLNDMAIKAPAMHSRYLSGARQANAGKTLNILAGSLMVGGFVMMVAAESSEDFGLAVVGAVAVIIGTPMLAVGIPLNVVGNQRRNASLRSFCNQVW